MDSPTVFLVDDEEDVRSTLSRALKKRGPIFETARAFLDQYQDDHGCLVLDYGMPDINGLRSCSL